MSLFVGNISRDAKSSDIEKEFRKYGHCTLKFKGSYAFIEYDDEKDAEEAIKKLNKTKIENRELNIEWSKKSGKFDPKTSRSGRKHSSSPRRRDIRDEKCYRCGHRGHYSYECRERDDRNRRSSRYSRSRSRSNSRSRSRHRDRGERGRDRDSR